MHKGNRDKAQMLIDSLKLRWPEAKCGSRGRSLAVPLSLLGASTASTAAHCKTNAERYFLLFTFFIKLKIRFRFPSVSENRYQGRSSVKQTFEKQGTPVLQKYFNSLKYSQDPENKQKLFQPK